MTQPQPIAWRGDCLRILDQTRLPATVEYIDARSAADVAEAIRRLAVRGAPLIGIAAAYGLALEARNGGDVRTAAAELVAARPTAVNLRWAVDRVLDASHGDPARAEAEAARIHQEQIEADERIGRFGADLIGEGATVLTHCNAGGLATGGIGTALGVIKTAHGDGKRIRALVDETRPLLQGTRLTAWELAQAGVPYEVIVDAAAPGIIARGLVQAIVVGADRIAANGDVANKVGTYGLALAASAHGVPFYVAAPLSTVDVATPDGAGIRIEERDDAEVLAFAGTATAPAGASARNPAFDVTPAALVTAFIADRGVLRPPYDASIAASMQQAVATS
ncbi:MAG: S-methyl-5-thioribose-1-phosphate isomerase [Dehalococcoidia bacterium]|nr:MAG: S-methyl-5-thioribose-1-phosphate isomerase [Dehalococcoidia bacterium]